MVIHFKSLAYLDDYVLNPRWLTHGVYTLMYHKIAQLNERDIVDILCNKPIFDEHGNQLDYPADKCRFIMDAMREFKLCYPLPCDYKTLIIPELLPSDQPSNIDFDKNDALAFEFVFRGFLPRHLMPELIVNRHEEIVSTNNKQIVWQRGVLLQHKTFQAQALLRVDYHEKVLSILVKGGDAKEYLSILNDEVLKILGRLTLDYEERVELPISACIEKKLGIFEIEKVDYRQLLNSVKNGIYRFPTKHNIYDLRKVLGIIMPEIELSKLGIHIDKFINHAGDKTVSNITQNINNSTVRGSVIAAEKVENCFNILKESKANSEVKTLLEQLVLELKSLNENEKVPATQGQQLADMSEGVETLIKESNRETPRKEWYQLSFKGIKEAALVVGEIAQPIIAIAEKLSPLLLA